MSRADEPAFPVQPEQRYNDPIHGVIRPSEIYGPSPTGLTKREYFAAMAMQGILVNPGSGSVSLIGIARDAVRQADALIAELEKEPTR